MLKNKLTGGPAKINHRLNRGAVAFLISNIGVYFGFKVSYGTFINYGIDMVFWIDLGVIALATFLAVGVAFQYLADEKNALYRSQYAVNALIVVGFTSVLFMMQGVAHSHTQIKKANQTDRLMNVVQLAYQTNYSEQFKARAANSLNMNDDELLVGCYPVYYPVRPVFQKPNDEDTIIAFSDSPIECHAMTDDNTVVYREMLRSENYMAQGTYVTREEYFAGLGPGKVR